MKPDFFSTNDQNLSIAFILTTQKNNVKNLNNGKAYKKCRLIYEKFYEIDTYGLLLRKSFIIINL